MAVRLLPSAGTVNSTIFVLGATRRGKTQLIANLVAECPRFVVFDMKNEYAPEFFGNNCKVASNTSEFVHFLNENESQIIFNLSGYPPDDADLVLSNALLTLYQFQLVNIDSGLPPVTVALDELNRFVETRTAPLGIKELIQRGSGVRIEKIFGAQWFGTVPSWVRDSFTEIYVFKHNDPAGLQRLSQAGFNPDEVKNLPKYHVLHENGGNIEMIALQATEQSVRQQIRVAN